MRTTVSINDHLLEGAKQRARQRGQTLGQVIEDALRLELTEPSAEASVDIPVFDGGDGPQPGVDLTSNRSVRAALETETDAKDLR